MRDPATQDSTVDLLLQPASSSPTGPFTVHASDESSRVDQHYQHVASISRYDYLDPTMHCSAFGKWSKRFVGLIWQGKCADPGSVQQTGCKVVPKRGLRTEIPRPNLNVQSRGK